MKYVCKRILMLLVTMVIVSLLAFAAFELIHGSAAEIMLGTQATPEMLLGTAVVNGESPAFGFPPDTYLIAPSLRVYELFMWYDENERWTRN